jgi:TonB-dependent starch-binding outer membrane protein SusC
MRKLKLLLLSSLILLTQQLWAQTKTVTGKVTDSKDGTGLFGATISYGGKGLGITNSDGSFSVAVPSSAKSIVISSIGYNDQEVTIDGGIAMVKMVSGENKALTEVVVTGYKSQSKRSFAGSAGIVKGDNIRTTPIASFDQVLQGQTPGLLLRAGSGQPGNSGSIIIRGRGSIQGSTEPIFIVDGIQIGAGDFALLNPNDIENVAVLKDAVASSLYGSRGGNGVIVVTTRKGNSGKPKLEVDAYTGWSSFPDFNDFRVMTTNEKIDYELRRGGTSLELYSPGEIDSLRKINTDWKKLLTQTGRTYNLNGSASGGSEKTKYFVSVNYFKQEGSLINTGFDRITGRANITQEAGDFTFGINTTAAYSGYSNTAEINAGIASPLNALQWANPYEQPFVPGSYNAAANFVPGGSVLTRPRVTETGQPIGTTQLFWNNNKDKQIRVVASGNAEYRIPFVKGLSVKTVYGIDYSQDELTGFTDRRTYSGGFNPRPASGASANFRTSSFARDNFKDQRITNTNSLNYANTFGDHTIDGGVYYEYIAQKTANNGYTGFLLASPFQNEAGFTVSADLIPRLRGGGGEARLQSYFATANYGFKNKYFLNANFRRDGSSRFGLEKRYANFGGVGVSWIVTDESFMQSLKNSWLSSLKFKASYGTVGSQEGIGFYASQGNIGTRLYNAALGNQQTSIDLPDLQWESRKKFNTGVEFSLFKNKVSGGIEVYNEVTDNLFFPRQLSRTTGFTTVTTNIGAVRNRGLEFNANYDILRNRDWKISFNGNITYNKNEVTRLDVKDTSINGFIATIKGLPLNSIYLVNYVGVNPANGEAQYKKLDKSTTETFDLDDRTTQGTSDPNIFGGFGFSVDYKGIALTTQFTYMLNSVVYNNERANLENPDYYFDNMNADLLKEWQNPGDITNIPSPSSLFEYETTRYLENNSFLRLRNVGLSYSLPKKIAETIKLKGIMVYVNGTNLWVSTKYRGRDPEFPGASITGAQYPALRTAQAGIRVNF